MSLDDILKGQAEFSGTDRYCEVRKVGAGGVEPIRVLIGVSSRDLVVIRGVARKCGAQQPAQIRKVGGLIL